MPYHRSKRREVLVQKFDGTSWSILPTVLRRGSEGHSSHPGGRPARVKHRLRKNFFLQLLFSLVENITTLVSRRLSLVVPAAGLLCCAPVLLVYGGVPTCEGQLLSDSSRSAAGVHL